MLAKVAAGIAFISLLAVAQPAGATYPGRANGRIAYVTGGNIWTVNPDGTSPMQLTTTGLDADPRWSPDGKRIAFDRSSGVWTINADGSSATFVIAGTQPNWSPDGHWLAYAGSGPQGRYSSIFKRRLGTTRSVQVSHPKRVSTATPPTYANDSLPAWSQDGTTIAFVRNWFFDYDSTQELWTVKSGVETAQVGYATGYHYFPSAPSWGPGGRNLLYGDEYSSLIGPAGIYQFAPGGTPLLVVAGPSASGPAWAPHLGIQIVYQNASPTGPPPFSLYVASASGGNPQMIVADGSQPDWQPIP